MKFQPSDDGIMAIIISFMSAFVILGFISLLIWATEPPPPMTPDGTIYIKDISENFDVTIADTEDVQVVSSNHYDTFVLTDYEYTFSDIENYELYSYFSSPISFNGVSSLGSKEIDYIELFDAIIAGKTYEDIGIYDSDIKGLIKLELQGSKIEQKMLKAFIRNIYPEKFEELFDKLSTQTNSSSIKLSFGHYIGGKNLKFIKSNLPATEARFALYKHIGEEHEVFEVDNIVGMTKIEEFAGDYILPIYREYEAFEELQKTEAAEKAESESVNDETSEEDKEAEDTNEENEKRFKSPIILIVLLVIFGLFSLGGLFLFIEDFFW